MGIPNYSDQSSFFGHFPIEEKSISKLASAWWYAQRKQIPSCIPADGWQQTGEWKTSQEEAIQKLD